MPENENSEQIHPGKYLDLRLPVSRILRKSIPFISTIQSLAYEYPVSVSIMKYKFEVELLQIDNTLTCQAWESLKILSTWFLML